MRDSKAILDEILDKNKKKSATMKLNQIVENTL